MITTLIATKVLTKIVEKPEIIGEIVESLGAMPNIPTPTMGGKVFWTDLANVNGWRIQQNTIFKNCRIIDPNNIRRAWGGETAMLKIFKKILES